MAWRKANLPEITWTYEPINSNIYTQIVNVPSDNYNNIGQILSDISYIPIASIADTTIIDKNGYSIKVESISGVRYKAIYFRKPNSEYAEIDLSVYLSGTTQTTWGIFMDDENEVATFAPYATNFSNATRCQAGINLNALLNSNWLYTFLKEVETPPYEWTCIHSVNGKLGLKNFSLVDDEILSDTMNITDYNTGVVERIEQTNVFDNLLVGVETDWFWAGELDRATITLTRQSNVFIYVFKFYMAFSTLPFATWNIQDPNKPFGFGFMIDADNQVVVPFYVETIPNNQGHFIKAVTTSDEDKHQYYLFFRGHYDDENPEDDPENTDTEDDGDDSPWQDIAVEGLTVPSASAVETGFTTMYEIGPTELKNLSSFLWSDNFMDNVSKFFSDPKDIIVGLSISPIKPDTEGEPSIIKAGRISTGVSGNKLSSQYKLTETLGSIYIKKAIKQRFLNYPPYMRIVAHLPFVGEHVLDVNDIMGKTISLKYIFDFLTGSCIAEISVDDKPRYFFGGASGVQIPTSEENFSRQYSSILSAGATLGSVMSTMATGGLTAPMTIGAASGTLQNLMTMSPQVEYSSGGGAINGLLSTQAAYITIEEPVPKRSFEQVKFLGRPCLQGFKLKELHGFTKCMDVHLTDIKCTDDEKSKIYSLLTAGILIETGTPTPTLTPVGQRNTCIQFMQNISEKNVIGKTWNTEADSDTGALAPLVLEGSLVYEQSISSPKFTVQGDIRGYNYCYIPIFNRFYYVKDIQINGADVVTVPMEVDVLQSFKDEILECDAMIDRQEYEYNTYYNDSNIWCKQYKVVSTYPFVTSNGDALTFPRENNTYILTIAGGD